MKDNKLLAYYTILFLYLIVAFFLNTNLRITGNVLFCILSIFFFYDSRKKTFKIHNVNFMIFLNLIVIGCFTPLWRSTSIGLALEIFNLIIAYTFMLLSIKNKDEYLLLGTKWALIIGILLILLLIFYFTTDFLPYISDFHAPLLIILIFLVGFIFIILFIQTVNNSNYFLLLIGICFVIASGIIAGISIYHNTSTVNNFLEDALTILAISFLTTGMLKIDTQKTSTTASIRRNSRLSLLNFMKKIF